MISMMPEDKDRSDAETPSSVPLRPDSSTNPYETDHKRSEPNSSNYRETGKGDGNESPWHSRYQILQKIGEGGMGTVRLARDVVLKRLVALKFIRASLMIESDSLARFYQEAQAVAQLAHPNIVTLFGLHPGDHTDDAPFIEMEYIEGIDLSTLVKQRGPLDVWQAHNYIRMAALGLQHAHEKGLVHRDIKPSNLMLTTADSVIKILDFGLARLLRLPGDGAKSVYRTTGRDGVGANPFVLPNNVADKEGLIIGTPMYMAPEQWSNPNVDIRADIYSLGCTFYYLLSGSHPFSSISNISQLHDTHITNRESVPIEAHRPEIPRKLAATIKRMMAKKPEERHQTPAELIVALDRLLQPSVPPPQGKLQTVDDLVIALRRHQLLEDRQLDQIELSLASRFTNINDLLVELRLQRLLTDYQCAELLAGNGKRLSLGETYILLRPLGEGSIGRVFLARPRLQGRHVAIKVIKPELACEAEFVGRFRQEILLTSQLSHPNVVMMFGAEESEDRLFLVMEYLEGKDLDAVIKDRKETGKAVTAVEACRWMLQVAQGLEHIHSKNMVHRDIKPANLFLTASTNKVKILDLGVARVVRDSANTRLTRTRTAIGTYDYMAPEQARKPREVDISADLYSLGCSFYHVLTGEVPFLADSEADAIVQHTLETAVPIEKHRPDLPNKLAGCIRKLMEKKPKDRYNSPTDLVQVLTQIDQTF